MVKYNPFDKDVMNDPHSTYRKLRAEAPVYYIEEFDAWALAKFEDIWKASMDTRHYTAAKGTTSAHLLTKVQPVTPMINMMDPPQHTKLRTAVRHHFTPAAIGKFEPIVREIAVKALDEARERGGLDVMGDMASNVSVTVACLVIGIPLEDAPMMNDLVWRFFARDPEIDGMTPDGLAAMEELFGYFVQLVQQRRAEGSEKGDVIDLVSNIEIDGEKFDDMAIASHLTMFVIGGSETFPKTFATTLQRLAEHPEQRARCAADPSLIPGAYEEALRYDMPTQFLGRTLLEDVEIHGQTMRKGDAVLFLYPSANRDEREFGDDPDRFDIDRRPARILTFGAGTHACLGFHVAKMEGKVCLEEVLAAWPEYEPDLEAAERLRTEFVQGYATFPITY